MNEFIRRRAALLLAGVIFLLAFVPLAVPERAVQTDEIAHWIERTDIFVWAMRNGRFGNTVQTEHPGVTVVALGAIAQASHEALFPNTELPPHAHLHLIRFPLKLVNALLIALGYLLLRRLVPPGVAFGAALLWACSPYLRWHMRLLHIDGLTTNFMMLSFLLVLLALPTANNRGGVHWQTLLLAAFVGGLAALTRFSSLYVAGVVGVVALIAFVSTGERTPRRFGVQVMLPVVVFTLTVALTWTALYPGMWTNARGVYGQSVHGVDNATSAHGSGSFFLGTAVDDPGAAFYPVVLLARTSPIVLVGVLLAAVAALRGALQAQWRVWLAVALYALFYLLMLTLLSKKFDRYALPVYPALALLAAAGWGWLVGSVGRVQSPRWQRVAWGAAVVVVAGHALWYLPDEYAYTNPLYSGNRTQATLMVGGGEGLQSVFDFYAGVDETVRCEVLIASSYTDIVSHYVPCARTISVRDVTPTNIVMPDYFVNYVNFDQREPAWAAVFAELEPIHTAVVHGITFFELYDGDDVRRAYANAPETAWQHTP